MPDFDISGEDSATKKFTEAETRREDLLVDASKL